MSRERGITEQQLHELERFEDSDAFTDLEKLVLRLTVGMTRTPVHVPAALIHDLRAQMSPAAVVEIVTAIAHENYRARWNIAFDVPSHGFSDGTFCPLPEPPPPAP